MGRPKQLLAYAGKSLVRHVMETAIAVGEGPVVVVVGAAAGEVDAHVRDLPVGCIENERWERGIGSSIRAGMSLPSPARRNPRRWSSCSATSRW